MISTSFKGSRIRPESYRTPSPPNPAIELLTPPAADHVVALGVPALDRGGVSISQEETGNINSKSHVSNRNDQDTMNAFALIALATSPPAPHLSATYSSRKRSAQAAMGEQHLPEAHVAKRAKSELLRSPEWRRNPMSNDLRPATSYDAQAQSSKSDAELLLNFSQIARRTHDTRTMHRHTQSDQLHLSSPTNTTAIGKDNGHHSASGIRRDSPSAINRQAHWVQPIIQGKSVDQSPDDSRTQSDPKPPYRWGSHSPKTADYPYHTNITTAVHGVDLLASHKILPQTSDSRNASSTPIRQVLGFAAAKDAPNGLISEGAHDDGKNITLEDSGKTLTETTSQHTNRTFTPSVSGLKVDANGDGEDENADDIATKVSGSTSFAIKAGESIPPQKAIPGSICAACKFSRNSSSMDSEYNATSWISCDACKSWFHFACAGFRNEREVRGVDKFRCKACKPMHGATTFVRKSSRAHTAIDYAGLNEGVVKTSDERPEHHYIKPIKDGTITFLPETFARMPPELVTADFFERSRGMKEPIIIPASLNPRPHSLDASLQSSEFDKPMDSDDGSVNDQSAGGGSLLGDCEYEAVPEQEQDALDMIMPRGLTVRQVAELYGPEEKVEVIDVKSQNGESKKWNMRRWADYYESSGSKIVRNVISLEVSRSRLGRLIRRPQVVRDLDLQDSVWPAELQAKGEIPRVQFYCLMSVADCFTDFHIDFGGSSVFYHILRGRKTFLFIPPKEKHLKKYEEWCMSPAQNWTFLADQTKECYRVDLSPGDTMLIPAGWIHAVWTPEDSLVIGGNFLTRMNYGMQFRVAQLEKATGVARKFRYPQFQKLHWFAALKYLEEDPLPASVKDLLQDGGTYHRENPAHYNFDERHVGCMQGTEGFHARYYSQSELEGLPELLRYLLRTAMIDNGMIVDGITQETRNAVKRSIPRGHGEPLEIVKLFALWCAWKRGNEEIPPWAHLGAVPNVPEASAKLSAAAQRRMEREATLQGPRRQSARQQSQRQAATPERDVSNSINGQQVHMGAEAMTNDLGVLLPRSVSPSLRDESALGEIQAEHPDEEPMPKAPQTPSELSPNPRRKIACETCRQRRRACKHKTTGTMLKQGSEGVSVPPEVLDPVSQLYSEPQLPETDAQGPTLGRESGVQTTIDQKQSLAATWTSPDRSVAELSNKLYSEASGPSVHDRTLTAPADAEHLREVSDTITAKTTSPTTNSAQNRGRNNKACVDCRKSKVSSPLQVSLVDDALIQHLTFGKNRGDVYTTSSATRILSRSIELRILDREPC